MSRWGYVTGSPKSRRWLKKSIPVRRAAIDRAVAKFKRIERGWLYVWDETDRASFAHHWLEKKPVIHKGRKTRG